MEGEREKFENDIKKENENLAAREKKVKTDEAKAEAIMKSALDKQSNIDRLIREGVERKYKELEERGARR